MQDVDARVAGRAPTATLIREHLALVDPKLVNVDLLRRQLLRLAGMSEENIARQYGAEPAASQLPADQGAAPIRATILTRKSNLVNLANLIGGKINGPAISCSLM